MKIGTKSPEIKLKRHRKLAIDTIVKALTLAKKKQSLGKETKLDEEIRILMYDVFLLLKGMKL